MARHAVPRRDRDAAGLFTSVSDAHATGPNAMILLAPIGDILLAAGTVTFGVGLLRRRAGDQSRIAVRRERWRR